MLGAVLKLSYNNPRETPVTGGVCGSCFFTNPTRIITANHVLNKNFFKPNPSFQHCQYWILSDNFAVEIKPSFFIEFPEVDLTIISLDSKPKGMISECKFSTDFSIGTECYNDGFIGGTIPNVGALWTNNRLVIINCNLHDSIVKSEGSIKSIKRLHINAKDIKINDITGIEVSYGGHKGMSGGPLIKKETGEVVGLMSFGLPADVAVKQQMFAISAEELLKKI